MNSKTREQELSEKLQQLSDEYGVPIVATGVPKEKPAPKKEEPTKDKVSEALKLKIQRSNKHFNSIKSTCAGLLQSSILDQTVRREGGYCLPTLYAVSNSVVDLLKSVTVSKALSNDLTNVICGRVEKELKDNEMGTVSNEIYSNADAIVENILQVLTYVNTRRDIDAKQELTSLEVIMALSSIVNALIPHMMYEEEKLDGSVLMSSVMPLIPILSTYKHSKSNGSFVPATMGANKVGCDCALCAMLHANKLTV